MSNEMVQQRIKYLVEHGELYPVERRRMDRRMVAVLGALVVMNGLQCVLLFMLMR